MSVEGDAEEGGEELGMPEDEPAPEMPPGPEDAGEPAGMGMEGDPEEELPGLSEAEIVSVVAKRVAERLVKENKKSEMIDDLTERIFARLTQK